VRISKLELHEFAFDLRRLVFEIRRRKGMVRLDTHRQKDNGKAGCE
jgi:hypothetical protein